MISKRVVLHFPHKLLDQPIVSKLVKDYDLEFNILKAYVTPNEEGLLILGLTGEEENYKHGIEYLKKSGVKVQPLSRDIIYNENKCVHCGLCVPVCPSEALVTDPSTRRITFHEDKCIACEVCVSVCPHKAMEVKF